MDSAQINIMLQTLQQLENQVNQLTQQNQTLHQQQQALAAQTPTTASTCNVPAPKIPIPDKFDGTRSKYRTFINQLKMTFTLPGAASLTDTEKVAFTVNLLSGTAAALVAPLIERNDKCLSNYQEFMDKIAILDDPERTATAENALTNARQGRQAASTYATSVRRYVADTTWNEPAIIAAFREA